MGEHSLRIIKNTSQAFPTRDSWQTFGSEEPGAIAGLFTQMDVSGDKGSFKGGLPKLFADDEKE